MTPAVGVREVIGSGAFAAGLAAQLGVPARVTSRPGDGSPGDGSPGDGLRVLTSWRGPAHLGILRRAMTGTRWTLAHRTAAGAAVGPVFGTGGPCVDCYLRRAESNGWALPVPVSGTAVVPALAAALHGLPPGVQREVTDEGVVEHQLLPVPGCGCAEPSPLPGGLRQAVSARLGLVHAVRTTTDHHSGVTVVTARGCRTEPLHGGAGFTDGEGCAADPEDATVRALGEALERYCAGFVSPGLVTAARVDLPGASLPPDAHRFGDHPVSDRSRLRWTRGVLLATGAPAWVPAASVYLPYRCGPTEPPASRTSSEGLAAGPDLESAVRRATFEAIERDAFMRAWRHGTTVRPLLPPPGAVPGSVRGSVPGVRLALVPHPSGAAVVAAFLESTEVPYTAVGLAARLDAADAARAAVTEAMTARLHVGRSLAVSADPADYPTDTTRYHRYVHATDPRLRASRARWVAAPDAAPPPPATTWPEVVRRLPAAAYVDVTTPDVVALGVRVVRVVVEGFVGIDTDSGRPRLGGDPTPHPLS